MTPESDNLRNRWQTESGQRILSLLTENWRHGVQEWQKVLPEEYQAWDVDKLDDLRGIVLDNMDLSEVDLSYADLSYASLRGCLFFKTIFQGSSLQYADCRKSQFVETDLVQVNADHANFDEANFFGVQLMQASFENASFAQADFREVMGESSKNRVDKVPNNSSQMFSGLGSSKSATSLDSIAANSIEFPHITVETVCDIELLTKVHQSRISGYARKARQVIELANSVSFEPQDVSDGTAVFAALDTRTGWPAGSIRATAGEYWKFERDASGGFSNALRSQGLILSRFNSTSRGKEGLFVRMLLLKTVILYAAAQQIPAVLVFSTRPQKKFWIGEGFTSLENGRIIEPSKTVQQMDFELLSLKVKSAIDGAGPLSDFLRVSHPQIHVFSSTKGYLAKALSLDRQEQLQQSRQKLLDQLSERQRVVFNMSARGLGVREIATVLEVAESSVKAQLASLMNTLKVKSLEDLKVFVVDKPLFKLGERTMALDSGFGASARGEVETISDLAQTPVQDASYRSVIRSEFSGTLKKARDAFEVAYFEYHLRNEKGNVTRVSEITGLEVAHLYRKLKMLGIELSLKEFRESSG